MSGFWGACAGVLTFCAAIASVVGVAVGVDWLIERFEDRRSRRYQPDWVVLAANWVPVWKRVRLGRKFRRVFSDFERVELTQTFRALTESDETTQES